MDIKYQLFHPSNQRETNTERAIQTFKTTSYQNYAA